ncbi:MAG: AAA family ATPase [Ruminococcus sp.]|nr:AAA family ATPase [Ruminococcus sp.]
MENFARIQSIEINNFKNVSYGKILFSDYGKNNQNFDKNITAVYGQNGSGKTALIDAIELVKSIVLGRSLRKNISNYIKKGFDRSSINISFYFNDNHEESIISYSVIFGYNENNVVILDEQIKSKECINNVWNSNTEIIHYNSESRPFSITPKYLYTDLTNTTEKALELGVAQSLSQRIDPDSDSAKMVATSLIFSKSFLKLLETANTKSRLEKLLKKVRSFCSNNLLIVNDKTFGGIAENIHAIPIYIKQKINNMVAIGSIPIEIYKSTQIPSEIFPIYQNFLKQINAVIPTIIPGITLRMTGIEEKHLPNGRAEKVFSMVTVRDNQEISLEYESAGVKKILCILSSLISTFNNPDMCFVVDELDSGVFEYLIGQIITVFKEDAKGQLIFTSNNLHILELLDTKSIIITKFGSNNCYGKLSNVQTNNNKRLLYLKQIELSNGEDGFIYNKTNQYEMSYAFERAYDISTEDDNYE